VLPTLPLPQLEQTEEGKAMTEEEHTHLNNTTILATKKTCEEQEELVRRITDARKALEICSTTYKKTWLDWLDTSKNILPEMRQWRMSMDTEMATTLKKFAEVRQFFLSETHDTEVAKLKEFVGLCERLKALKEEGFLDKVADTILRLEVK
jgi:hypothetical protein